MSEHRNNIQIAIDVLYSQRRRKPPGDESETFTRRNDAIFGNYVRQTFAQYFPPGLERLSVQKKPQLWCYLPTTPSGEAE